MPESTRGMRMEHVYSALAAIGFLVPGIPMLMYSVRTGNWLFWADPARTTRELFATWTATTFVLDLFVVVAVALFWITHESRRLGMGGAWRFWVLTFIFGLGGPMPLFLGMRERVLARGARS
jgi:hypothetical protein